MATTNGVIKRGTAAEGAAFTDGFSASGEGQWSRQAASVGGNVKTASFVDPKPPGTGTSRIRGPRSKEQLLTENRAALEKLRQRVRRENVPARIVRLKSQIEIKTRFIERLELGDAK
jgi:hypothetical protein